MNPHFFPHYLFSYTHYWTVHQGHSDHQQQKLNHICYQFESTFNNDDPRQPCQWPSCSAEFMCSNRSSYQHGANLGQCSRQLSKKKANWIDLFSSSTKGHLVLVSCALCHMRSHEIHVCTKVLSSNAGLLNRFRITTLLPQIFSHPLLGSGVELDRDREIFWTTLT